MRGLAGLSFCLLLVPAAAFAQDLPDGPGAEVVERACQSCHGLEQVTAVQHDAEGWRRTVTQMVANGAILTDAEQDKVVQYLAANFGKAAK